MRGEVRGEKRERRERGERSQTECGNNVGTAICSLFY